MTLKSSHIYRGFDIALQWTEIAPVKPGLFSSFSACFSIAPNAGHRFPRGAPKNVFDSSYAAAAHALKQAKQSIDAKLLSRKKGHAKWALVDSRPPP